MPPVGLFRTMLSACNLSPDSLPELGEDHFGLRKPSSISDALVRALALLTFTANAIERLSIVKSAISAAVISRGK